jgi:hypothetical protein
LICQGGMEEASFLGSGVGGFGSDAGVVVVVGEGCIGVAGVDMVLFEGLGLAVVCWFLDGEGGEVVMRWRLVGLVWGVEVVERRLVTLGGNGDCPCYMVR